MILEAFLFRRFNFSETIRSLYIRIHSRMFEQFSMAENTLEKLSLVTNIIHYAENICSRVRVCKWLYMVGVVAVDGFC